MLRLSYVVNVCRKARGPNAGDGRKPHVERSAAVSGHRLRRASFVLLALACAFTLFLSGDVGVGQAQSVQEVVLVSNTEQIPWSASYVAGNASGLSATQGFHTGDDPGGYTLSTVGIGLLTNQFSGEETLILHIYSSNSDGTANALLYTLSPPATPGSAISAPGIVDFTAPVGSTLDPDTDYHVVVQASGDDGNDARLGMTGSNQETGNPNWTIENFFRRDGARNISRNSFRIRIQGMINPRVLVSNARQGDDADTSITTDHSQAFTVGSIERPYIVHGVTMISEDTEGDDLALQICGADSNGNPTTTCTDLTAPDSSAAGSLFFTAPTDPVLALTSGANYAVVFKTPGGESVVLDSTESNGEDTSSLSGWSIRDRSKSKSGANSWSENDDDEAIRITIHGKASVPPTLAPPTPVLAADGVTLTLSFSGSLKEASVPAGTAFTVKATPAGGSEAPAPLAGVDPVIVAGSTVTLKLATPIAHNDTAVKVSYEKPTSGVVIEDILGNDLETFPDQDVTNNSTIPQVSVEAVYPDASSLIALPVLRVTRSNAGTDNLLVTLDVTEDDDYVDLLQEEITIETGDTTSEKTNTLDYPGNTNGNLTYTLAPSQHYAPAISPGNAATVQIKAPASGLPITARHAQASWTVNEGDSVNAMVTFTLAPGLAAPRNNLRIFLNAEGEGAEPPDDYTDFPEEGAEPYVDAEPGGWAAAPGGGMTQTSAITTVETIQDTDVEANEVFYLDFRQDNMDEALDIPLTESDVPNNRTTVSILDDDPLALTTVEVTSSPTGGYYDIGDTIVFTATFNTYMTLEEGPLQERPLLEFELGGATRQAEGQEIEEDMEVTFEYTVAAEDSDDHDGISWGADTLSLNGGSIFVPSKGALIPRLPDLVNAAQGALSTHKVDTMKPSLVMASAMDTMLTLTFSEDLNTTAPAATAFTVTVDGGSGVNPMAVSIADRVVTLTLANAVTAGQTVTVSYTKPGTNNIKDLSGKEADAFMNENVTTAPPVEVTATFVRSSYTVAEGATVDVAVRLNKDPARTLTIPLTAMGQGAVAGDYSVASEVTFAGTETEKTVTFTATDDADDDDGESVQLAFGALPVAVTAVAPTQTTVSITDNDDPEVSVSFAESAYAVAEGGSVTVTVRLNADPKREVQIPLTATAQDGATPPGETAPDYAAPPTFVRFITGQTQQTFTFRATQDPDDDDGESVLLGFGTPPSRVSTGSPDTTTVSITDDDVPGVNLSRRTLNVVQGGSATYTVVLATRPTGDVTVTPLSDNPGVTLLPVMLTFQQTDWNSAQRVTVRAPAGSSGQSATISHTVSGYTGATTAPDVAVTVTVAPPPPTPTPTSRGGGGGGGGGGPRNQEPEFLEDDTTDRSIAESAPAGAAIGDPVTARDRDGDTLTYFLRGDDDELFDIDPAIGQLLTKAPLDYEARTDYSVIVSVTDGKNSSGRENNSRDDSITVMITVENVDEPGAIALSSNQPQVDVALTAALTDPDGAVSSVVWSWERSADRTAWTIIPGAALAAYTPVAADKGSYLRATASYTDGNGLGKSAQATTATLVPLNSAPVFTDVREDVMELSVAERTIAGEAVSAPVAATDAENDALTYTLGGVDAALFAIDADTGQIRVGAGTALDYEADKNVYEVTVTATDSLGVSATVPVTIRVTDVDLGPYDVDKNEVIERDEALAAVVDYFTGRITKDETVAVVLLYFAG